MKFATVAALAGLLALPGAAMAAPMGYSLTIGGDTNVPTFNLSNTSGGGGENIVGFMFSINQSNRGFDGDDSNFSVGGSGAVVGLTVNSPTTSAHVQTLDFSYNDFTPGETHTFTADVDVFPTGNVGLNFNEVFFNNPGDNADFTVFFSGGGSLSLVLPDVAQTQSLYRFSEFVDDNSTTVPAPAGIAFLALGALGLGLARRRR